MSYTITGDGSTSATLSPSSCPSASSNVSLILGEPYNSGILTGGVVAPPSFKIPVELWTELKREKLLDPHASTPN